MRTVGLSAPTAAGALIARSSYRRWRWLEVRMGACDVVCLGILVADVDRAAAWTSRRAGRLARRPRRDHAPRRWLRAEHRERSRSRSACGPAVVGKVGADPFGDYPARAPGRARCRGGEGVSPRRAASHLDHRRARRLGGRADVPARAGRERRSSSEELDPERLYAGRALHLAGALVMESLDGEPFAPPAPAEARRRGILTSLDPVWDPTRALVAARALPSASRPARR